MEAAICRNYRRERLTLRNESTGSLRSTMIGCRAVLSKKTAPDVTCFTSGAGKETAGKPSVRLRFSNYSTAPVRTGGAGSLFSSRSRGIGTKRLPMTGSGSSENKPSS